MMKKPQVRAEVEAIRNAAVDAGIGVLCEEFKSATEELADLVKNATVRDCVKFGAVKLAINTVVKSRRLDRVGAT